MAKFLHTGVILAVIIATVQSLRYQDCGSSKAKINKVSVTDCDKSDICQLKKGSTYTIAVDFTPSESVTKATTVVHGILKGIPLPFPIDNPDACKNCGMTCPATSGKSVPYHSDITVKSAYPKVKVIVKWEVKDQNGDDLVCITLPAEIVDADKKVKKPSLNDILKNDKDTVLRFKSLS